MKWLGALLIISTTTWIGFEWSFKLTNRPKHIRQLKNALQMLEAEILYSQLPLHEAFFVITKQIPYPTKIFFKYLSEHMSKQTVELLSLWDKAINQLRRHASLGKAEYEIIEQFGQTLGQHDFQQQQKHIHLTISHLDREMENARDDAYKYAKTFRSLGFLCGLFVVILLI